MGTRRRLSTHPGVGGGHNTEDAGTQGIFINSYIINFLPTLKHSKLNIYLKINLKNLYLQYSERGVCKQQKGSVSHRAKAALANTGLTKLGRQRRSANTDSVHL